MTPKDFCLGCSREVYFVRGEMEGCKCLKEYKHVATSS